MLYEKWQKLKTMLTQWHSYIKTRTFIERRLEKEVSSKLQGAI